jgi:hypothetical protein
VEEGMEEVWREWLVRRRRAMSGWGRAAAQVDVVQCVEGRGGAGQGMWPGGYDSGAG